MDQSPKDTGSTGGAQPANAQKVERPESPRKKRPFLGALSAGLAVSTWKRQVEILNNRRKFPLLRQVLKNSLMNNRVLIPVELIDDQFVMKSIYGHRVIMTFMGGGFLYSLHLFVKGLAVAIRFDHTFNAWLISSLPMMLYTAIHFGLSYKVHAQFSTEIKARLLRTLQSAGNTHAQG